MDCGDDCTTTRIYLILLNCTPKKVKLAKFMFFYETDYFIKLSMFIGIWLGILFIFNIYYILPMFPYPFIKRLICAFHLSCPDCEQIEKSNKGVFLY